MDTTFRADAKAIKNIFSEELTYNIPRYQRPYSRQKDQIENFCNDIVESFENKSEHGNLDDYLLGSIILVTTTKDSFDVIDGQQRLTTISIFLAALKEFVPEEIQNEIKNDRIFKKRTESPRVSRISTDEQRISDFHNILVLFDVNDIKNKIKNKGYKKDCYYNNALQIYEYFNDLKNKDFDFYSFYDYFLSSVYLIQVTVSSQSNAMKLFEVLNNRGLDLQKTDLIKNLIIEKIYKDYKEDAKTKESSFICDRKKIDKEMKSLGESMDDIFTYFVYYKLGTNPKKDLFEEFKNNIFEQRNIFNGSIEEFEIDFKKFSDLYISLYKNTSDIKTYQRIHSMKHLKESRFWKTIILSYLMKNGENKKEEYRDLVYELFRFYFLNRIAGETVNPYKQLSFKLIESIKLGFFVLPKEYESVDGKIFSIDGLKEIFSLYLDDKKRLERVKEELLSKDIYRESRVKSLLFVIEYEYMDGESENVRKKSDKKITIEHIYPQSPKEEDRELKEYVNSLGNLTLLYGGRNSSFSNGTFIEKKQKYLKDKKTTDFKLTNKVFEENENRTIENIKSRTEEIITSLEEIFRIKLK